MRLKTRKNGFTLVELLIVVAIIGILAAILTPQFLNARKNAAEKAARAYAHNVYTAMQRTLLRRGISIFSACKWSAVILMKRQITTITFQNLALLVGSP